MRTVAAYYFEDFTGFLYEKKQPFSGGCYFIPLNFCTLDCKLKTDNNVPHQDKKQKSYQIVQKYSEHRRTRIKKEHSIGSNRVFTRSYVQNKPFRWNKITHKKSIHGSRPIANTHYSIEHRRTGVYNLLRTSPTIVVSKIRPKEKTKN